MNRSAQEALLTQLKALGLDRLTALHRQIKKQQRLAELHDRQTHAVTEEDYEEGRQTWFIFNIFDPFCYGGEEHENIWTVGLKECDVEIARQNLSF